MSMHTCWPRLVAVLGVALLVAVVGSRSPDVFADPKGFVFTPLVFLGVRPRAVSNSLAYSIRIASTIAAMFYLAPP